MQAHFLCSALLANCDIALATGTIGSQKWLLIAQACWNTSQQKRERDGLKNERSAKIISKRENTQRHVWCNNGSM
ncbi:Hypothetical protein SMAX5B_015794 [Scophthalmus maximus]|uniref:Secreted protein n=1 Tax=Scophthalmus maximus TaxID=52904 RepID=A0A2U9D0T7_SCOMX|nr:Hypothetical protein SMAX5B_015794 [Scophthalmus maximus]